jgi:putative membrane protein
MELKSRFPHILLAAYIILFIALAINPYSREVWFAENLPIVLIVLALVLTYRRFRFSNTAYALMSVLIFMHTIGGHYTFARVPFGFITDLFGFERNHYDRIAHFSVGFYAYALAELSLAKKWIKSKWVLLTFPVFFILSVAAGYEIIEWQFAVMEDSSAGTDFLGSQGDVWDAQKDMLADGLGALSAILLFWAVRRRDISRRNLA